MTQDRWKGYRRILLILSDALGKVGGDNFNVNPLNLKSTEVQRVTFIDADGRPINLNNLGVAAYDTSDIGYDIVLTIGQSNAQGNAKGIEGAKDIVHPKVWQYSQSGIYVNQIIQAVEPLQHLGGIISDAIGFTLPFSRYLAEFVSPNRQILILPCAVPGTGFSDNRWNPEDDIYNKVVEQTNAVLQLNPNNRLKAILWHQGENDVNLLNKDKYAERLDALVTSLRSDIDSASEVPFICAGFVPDWVANESARNDLQEALKELPIRQYQTAYVDTTGLKGESQNPSFFNAESQRELGIRYFEAFVHSLENKPASRIPDKVSEIIITPTDKSAKVTFKSTNATIWEYSTAESGSSYEDDVTSNKKTITIADLTPNTRYNFRIKAINELGESSYAYSAFTTTK